MLAIVSSDKKYINNILEKISYEKVESPNKAEIFKCNYQNHEFIIASLGYGKVNIGSNLRYICDKYNIKVILCIGTAGSIYEKVDIFSSIISTKTLQFDVDFIPNGYLSSVIPKLESGVYNANDDINECLKRASSKCGVNYICDLIATSDMFVSNNNLASSIKKGYNAKAVDCESGSVGEYAFVNNIPYSCIKVISNYAYNGGIRQYNLYDNEASNILQKIVHKFLKEFYE